MGVTITEIHTFTITGSSKKFSQNVGLEFAVFFHNFVETPLKKKNFIMLKKDAQTPFFHRVQRNRVPSQTTPKTQLEKTNIKNAFLALVVLSLSGCVSPFHGQNPFHGPNLFHAEKNRTKTIHNDLGGSVTERMDEISTRRTSKEQVAVKGNCFSACTLYLALVSDGLVCTTPNAQWGFHGVSFVGKEFPTEDEKHLMTDVFNSLMSLHYPQSLSTLFLENWQHLQGDELVILKGQDMIENHNVPEC